MADQESEQRALTACVDDQLIALLAAYGAECERRGMERAAQIAEDDNEAHRSWKIAERIRAAAIRQGKDSRRIEHSPYCSSQDELPCDCGAEKSTEGSASARNERERLEGKESTKP